jgi:hypothetical protein
MSRALVAQRWVSPLCPERRGSPRRLPRRSFPHCAELREPAPPADTSPTTSIARFIGEVTAVDAAAGSVALHVVTVENLPGDQSEDDFDGDNLTFTFGPNATFEVTPDRTGDGAGSLARHRGGRPRQGRRRGERPTPGGLAPDHCVHRQPRPLTSGFSTVIAGPAFCQGGAS